MHFHIVPPVDDSRREAPLRRWSRRHARGALRALHVFTPLFLFVLGVLGRPAPGVAEERKEVRVSVRPEGSALDLKMWAYRRHTKLQIVGTDKDFEKATEGLTVFVYDPKAPAENNCILKEFLDERNEKVRDDIHVPMEWQERCSGGGKGGAKGAGASAARALAQAGAVSNLSSPDGEKGGSPYGVAGGLNPNAESSPGLQAAVASVQIALSASEMKQIVERATRFIVARLTKQAEIDAIEKAALEGIEQLAKQGRAVSPEAIEEAAREAARKAEQKLGAAGGARAGSGAANGVTTTVHVPGPRKPPPLGASGTPMRTTSAPGGTLKPGPYAKEGVPARGLGRDFTRAERDAVNAEGVCHTCGSTDPKTKSGDFIPDHQPPSALTKPGEPQRLYPHCKDCARLQGGEVNGTRTRKN